MKIDLNQPEGNANALMGLVRSICRQVGREDWKAITAEMRQGDYKALLDTMDRHFPDFFDFQNDPRKA